MQREITPQRLDDMLHIQLTLAKSWLGQKPKNYNFTAAKYGYG